MRWLRQPDVLLLLALVLLTAGGATLLAQPFATAPDEREQRHFQNRQYYQSAFDALSAAAGAGLTIRSGEYTLNGRRILVGLSVAGGLIYLAAAWSASRNLRAAIGAVGGATPRFALVFAAWCAVLTLNVAICAAAGWSHQSARGAAASQTAVTEEGDDAIARVPWPESAALSGAAISVGADPTRSAGRTTPTWTLAVCGLIAALGWPIWLFLFGGVGRRFTYGWLALRRCLRMLLLWVVIAGVIALLDTPTRSMRSDRPDSAAPQTGFPRFISSLEQTTAAAGAGAATGPLDSRSVSPGTQFALGVVVLVGGLAGAPNGGMHSALAGLGLATMLGLAGAGYARSGHATMLRCREAALRTVGSMVCLTLVVTLGLLAIQRLTSSPFDERPSFSAAWLDASSAVAGAALTSGVVAQVTNPNLTGGIGHSADTYQYGLLWLMAAMLVGRVLPVRILRQAAQGVWHDTPAGGSPLL